MFIEASYISYLIISIAMTIWVEKTLSGNGRIFLVDCCTGNKELADSVNHLLVVGFYLVNFGYILLSLQSTEEVLTLRAAIELVSLKLGLVLLVLGLLHFINMYVLTCWRRSSLNRQQLPG